MLPLKFSEPAEYVPLSKAIERFEPLELANSSSAAGSFGAVPPDQFVPSDHEAVDAVDTQLEVSATTLDVVATIEMETNKR